MFYMCGLDPAFMDSFLGAVSAAVLCAEDDAAKTPMDMRLVCCAYMSSFMGRASFVPVQRMRQELDSLVKWAHKYVAENKSHDSVEAAGGGAAPATAASRHTGGELSATAVHSMEEQQQQQPPAARHRLFYSVLQCIFYVTSFRHKELFDSPDCRTWMRSLDLRRLVSSWLKPLVFCSPDICRIFVHIVKDAKVIDCSVAMDEATEAWSTHHRYNASTAASFAFLLQSFFPFDPYQLPISLRHVHAVGYLRFRDCIGEEVRELNLQYMTRCLVCVDVICAAQHIYAAVLLCCCCWPVYCTMCGANFHRVDCMRCSMTMCLMTPLRSVYSRPRTTVVCQPTAALAHRYLRVPVCIRSRGAAV